MDRDWALFLTILLLASGVSFMLGRRLSQVHRARERLLSGVLKQTKPQPRPRSKIEDEPVGISRWLFLAGYRGANGVGTFLLLTVGLGVFGAIAVLAVRQLGVFSNLEEWAATELGTLGLFIGALLRGLPLFLLVAFALLPTLVVRARRRKIVSGVDQELAIYLELLATLGEAGLSFDAGVTRILESSGAWGYLAEELEMYQREKLAGYGNVRCLRRLSSRLDVPAVSSFVSAMVQAEQLGVGVSQVLRQQADEVRGRRREESMRLAQGLPVKLVFPLVICFLPGVFVLTLGPAFVSFLDFVTDFSGGR